MINAQRWRYIYPKLLYLLTVFFTMRVSESMVLVYGWEVETLKLLLETH